MNYSICYVDSNFMCNFVSKIVCKYNVIVLLLMPLIFLLLIPLLFIFILYQIFQFFHGLLLQYEFRKKYCSKGKYILFVYSESPNWQEYIETNIFPVLEEKTVFLNWSKREEWRKRKPLEAKILLHWGGDTAFNPMAIIFSQKWRIETVRFYQAFKNYKHGKDKLLKKKEEELYAYL